MSRRHSPHTPLLTLLTVVALSACASPVARQDPRLERERSEAIVREFGLGDDPAIEASRAELDAARAREDGTAIVDGVEIRTEVTRRNGTRQDLTARVPIANLLATPAERAARRHETDAARARLRSTVLKRRADQCLPILDHEVLGEARTIYQRYEERQRSLLDWNHELHRAGVVDEVQAARFELSNELKLDTRDPEPAWSDPPSFAGDLGSLVLPGTAAKPALLVVDRPTIRAQVAKHQPALAVHRALADRYQALARRETARGLPFLKFVDLNYEPVARRGDAHGYGAQVGIEVPFGFESRSERRRYEALARGERSKERFALEERVRLTEAALSELAHFEQHRTRWQTLLNLAQNAEGLADQWRKQQLALPSGISGLLDDVYEARRAALDARERAGLASCRLLASTGIPVAEWPRQVARDDLGRVTR